MQFSTFTFKKIIGSVFLFVFIFSVSEAQNKAVAIEKSRSVQDRYAGLHFDFHAGLGDRSIGKTFTNHLIDSLIRTVKPDFIQVDCKGHAGISSYPTQVGNKPDHFEKDILKIWREVTAQHGIPLFVHYSGIWDSRAIELNPQWARINADNSSDKNAISFLGGYSQQLMHPQLVELAKDYQLDGAWIDGDCWVLGTDYSPAVMEAFTKETGITTIPRKQTEAHYFEWMEFNRKLFRKYITDYVNAAHKANPDFKITSNWSFSSMMPEKVDVPVDFLSGDVAGSNSLYSSAFESRCLALQGKPWDLMSWSFAWKNNQKSTKSVAQLKQEAAQVLAMGGGFQTYWQQNRDGTPEPYQFGKMAEIIKFSKERKAFCYEGEIIPQVGLLFSTYSWKRKPASGLYSSHSQEALKGILHILLDSQLPVEILMDHQLASRLEKFPVIILPEWDNIDPLQKAALLKYVENGGKLIVVGSKAIESFTMPLGIEKEGNLKKDTLFYAGHHDHIMSLKTDFSPVQPWAETKTVGSLYLQDDMRFKDKFPLATVREYGKGKMAGICMNIGDYYTRNKNPFMPDLMKSIINEMGVTLTSSVSGSSFIHQVLARKNDKTYVHLINTSGPHDNPNVMVYEEVSDLKGITVTLGASKAPKMVKLQPENSTLKYKYINGNIVIEVPKVAIHSILEISQ
jgi:hypothetical protein